MKRRSVDKMVKMRKVKQNKGRIINKKKMMRIKEIIPTKIYLIPIMTPKQLQLMVTIKIHTLITKQNQVMTPPQQIPKKNPKSLLTMSSRSVNHSVQLHAIRSARLS